MGYKIGLGFGVNLRGVQFQCECYSAIYLENKQMYHAKTKHIDVMFHKIRELLTYAQILFEDVHTSYNDNVIYMLTESITTDKFKH